MYSPRIQDHYITRLYHLREYLKQQGVKSTMKKLVDEAVGAYLAKREKENKQRETQQAL